MGRVSKDKLYFSRKLRIEQTKAEGLLWHLLRYYFPTYKFRRQHVIPPYIVDFCCLRIKLIIELDGGQHVVNRVYDRRRTNYLINKGFRVLRFWDNQVFGEIDGMLQEIQTTLEKTSVPSPYPLPRPAGEE